MKIPFYRSSPVCVAIAVLTILTVAGCGGSGTAVGPASGANPDTLPQGDDFPNDPFHAFTIFPDNGAVAGAINFASTLEFPDGDEDWFRFTASAGVTYVLQFRSFPVPFPDASFPNFIDLRVFEADALTNISLTSTATLPAGLVSFADDRVMFTGQSNGNHFIRIAHDRPLTGTGNYVFNLASSQFGEGATPLVAFTKGFNVSDDDGNTILNRNVTGFMQIVSLDPGTRLIRLDFGTERVAFLDNMGVEEEEPETSEVHIHAGFPDNFEMRDNNQTPSDSDDHGSVLKFTNSFAGGNIEVFIGTIPSDVFRLMVGQDWYADLHFTTDTDLVPEPILSGRLNGTLTFFESGLLMLGANVVPPVNTSLSLPILYNSANQRFMIDYEVGAVPSSTFPTGPLPQAALVGGALHIHLGSPTTMNGEMIIDLGVVPPVLALPQFETNPFIKNVVKALSDVEVAALRDATYNGGWYIDLHDPNAPFEPLLRANGLLGIGFFEIQTNPSGQAGGIPN